MIAAELASMPHGGDRSKPQNCGLPTKTAAKQLKVSPRTVETAKAVRKASPALAEEVKQGKTKLSAAVKKVKAKNPDISPPHPRGVSDASPKQSAKAQAADERFEKSAAILKDFAKTYRDVAARSRVISQINADLVKFGQLHETLAPFTIKETVKVLINQYGFEAVSDEVLEHNT